MSKAKRQHASSIAEANLVKGWAVLKQGIAIEEGSASSGTGIRRDLGLREAVGMRAGAFFASLYGVAPKVPTDLLYDSWLAQAMRAFASENNPQAIKMLLEYLLIHMGVRPSPKAIFHNWPPKMGKPGRGPAPERVRAYNAWVDLGEPIPCSSVLHKVAMKAYGAEYRDATPKRRKQLRDNCLKHIERELKSRVAELEHEVLVRERHN